MYYMYYLMLMPGYGDLLRTPKSHSNGVINCYSEPLLLLYYTGLFFTWK